MTPTDFLRVLIVRWYVAAIVLTASAALAIAWPPTKVVYYARTQATVLAPTAANHSHQIGETSAATIALAEVLAAVVNKGIPPARTSSADVPLYAVGYTDKVYARVRDDGNQWVSQVPLPVIQIEAVGPTGANVQQEVAAETRLITESLQRFQHSVGSSSASYATLSINPTEPSVQAIYSSRFRVLLATMLAGLGASLGLVYWVDRWITRV